MNENALLVSEGQSEMKISLKLGEQDEDIKY